MKKISKRILNKIQINIKRITFEGLGLSIILIFMILIALANTLRVIQNGQNNYNIYKTEQDSLERLREENKKLNEEYSVVSSDEYQKLLARDVLGLVEQGESLYRIEGKEEFYNLKRTYLQVKEKEGYFDWWISLIR